MRIPEQTVRNHLALGKKTGSGFYDYPRETAKSHISSSSDFSDAIALATGLEPGTGGVTAWTVDRTLEEGVTYYWRVQGSDGTFDSAFLSGEFTVDLNAPQYPGDLNGDLVVNFADFVAFIQLFNTVKGDGKFEEGADLNRDGAVNFADFVQFIGLFNTVYVQAPSSSKPTSAVLAYGIDTDTQFQLVGLPTASKEGAEFAADVVLSNAGNLKGYGLRIDYDPALLEFVKATAGGATLLQQDGRLADLFGALSHDPDRGELFLGSAITFGAPVEGEGTLVRLHFRLLEENPRGGLMNIVEGLLIDGKLNIQAAQNLGARLFLIPDTYALDQNYPNPFNPETTIQYAVPEPGRVTLRIFNILGQEVATLMDDDLLAGFYTARWNGRDHLGRAVASGVYLYRMQAGDFKQIHKMVLLK